MTKDDTYDQALYIFCSQNNTDGIKVTLKCFDTIDVLAGDGILFKLALSNNNYEICGALLDFFENKQNPSEGDKERLKDILEQETAFADLSYEMQKVLKNYIPMGSRDSMSDVTSIDLDSVTEKNNLEHEIEEFRDSSISTDEGSSFLPLTDANLSKLGNADGLIGTTDLLGDGGL